MVFLGYLQQIVYPAADTHFAQPYSTIYVFSRLRIRTRKMSARSFDRANLLVFLSYMVMMHAHCQTGRTTYAAHPNAYATGVSLTQTQYIFWIHKMKFRFFLSVSFIMSCRFEDQFQLSIWLSLLFMFSLLNSIVGQDIFNVDVTFILT